ncbi:glycoside hydrolase superfamily [Myxozyma melibiosi]|uniref:Glycoside hydrolase superfamily n=1 Tax=Myxozyma melibiosi TaxID=54550 RepID=A0ABR1F7H5_9ASCO
MRPRALVVLLLATLLASASASAHHRHLRRQPAPEPAPAPDAVLVPRDESDCQCSTYVVGVWVDYEPPKSTPTPTTTSYSSTTTEVVYVTVNPSANSSFWSNSSSSSVKPTRSAFYGYLNTSTPSVELTTTLTETGTVYLTPSSSFIPVSSSAEPTTTFTATVLVTPTTTVSLNTTLTVTPSPTLTTTTSETVVTTSTVYVTTTVKTTVTPTVYTELVTITAIPGPTYTIAGVLTTAVTDTETIVVPCSTYTVYSSDFFETLETSTYFITYTQTSTATWLAPASTTASSETEPTSSAYVGTPVVVPANTSTVASSVPTTTLVPTTVAPEAVTTTSTSNGVEVVIISTPDVTVTTDATYYETVSCTSGGVYTVTGGVVTTVTADTLLAVATTAASAKRLVRREETVFQADDKPLAVAAAAAAAAESPSRPWAISYSPYTDEGACKSPADIALDINLIASKGFRAVRIYSTDCGSLTTIGKVAEASGLHLILGLSINESGIEQNDVQLDDLLHFKLWDLVDMVVVGNEAVFNEFCTAAELATYIAHVRNTLRRAGYEGPVTTAETSSVLDSYASVLCPAIDVVGVNVHPFFDATISPEDAGLFVKQNMLHAKSACASTHKLPVAVLETGWPSAGAEANGAAVPGKAEQAAAVTSIMSETDGGNDVVFFTFADDMWKLAGLFGVEQRFGLIDVF